MHIDKFIEKTQQYKKLRSELKADIQLMVCRAKVLTETLYSVAATDDSIIDISEYEMYEELCCLEDIDETKEVYLSRELRVRTCSINLLIKIVCRHLAQATFTFERTN